MINSFNNKKIAITGGLGSIGSTIAKYLLNYNPKKIYILDNRETEIAQNIQNNQYKNIEYVFCDIKEKDNTINSLKGIDIVFHAAALKHVMICENNPFEAIKTNIMGTKNIIESVLHNDVKKMIYISTDKAVNPYNVMGATKLLGERLISSIALSHYNQNTKFGTVRFGNVLYSNGSVLEIWKNQINKNKPISITDPSMTRFIMSLEEAVSLIFQATKLANKGEIFIMKMPSVKIGDLLNAYLEYNKIKNYPITNIGIRKGEKKYEELLVDEDNPIMENDDFYIITPLMTEKEIKDTYLKNGYQFSNNNVLKSNDKNILLSNEEIIDIFNKSDLEKIN